MPGGCGDRRIPGGKKRAGVSDHLLEPGVQDELAPHVNCPSVYHGNGAVCGDRGAGKIIRKADLKKTTAV